MKKIFLGAFYLALLLTLFGCALPQPKAKTITDNQYLDPNIPSLDIKFPFKVWLREENTIGNQGGDVSLTHKVTTLGTSKTNTFVHIDKVSMENTHAYWTGVNYENEELFYKDKRRSSDGCFVYHKVHVGKHYLIGDILKYGVGRGATNIRISQYFSDIYSSRDLHTNHKDSVDEMISNVKDICSQVLSPK